MGSTPLSRSPRPLLRFETARAGPGSSSHRPTIAAIFFLWSSWLILVVLACFINLSLASAWSGQKAITCWRVCLGPPQEHSGSTSSTPTLANQSFSPITSVLKRKIAVATCFGTLSYRRVSWVSHPSLHVGAFVCGLATSPFHLSAHCSVISWLVSLTILLAWT